MRFPKEKVVITTRLNDYLLNNDFFEVMKMKDEILDNYQVLEPNVFAQLISSAFLVGNFEEVIRIGEALSAKEKESFDTIYYYLLACIGITDIYRAMSFIKRSKLLNLEEIKIYHIEDGANYSNLLRFSSALSSATQALLIVNFVEGIARELTGNLDIDKEYLLFRFFDLINMIYEIGYPFEIIESLTQAIKIIFNLDL